MSTQAAKRRRVDAANAVLRKPFQSPMIKRPDASPSSAGGTPRIGTGTGNIGTPDTAATPAKRSFEEVYSPGSPSVPRQQQEHQKPHPQSMRLRYSKSLGESRQTRPALPSLKCSQARASARSVDDRRASGGHAGGGGPDLVGDGNGSGNADDGDDDNPFLALVRAHRTTGQEAMIKDVDKQLETIRQARRIEDASEGRHPGGTVDQELRDLIVKWKGACRLAVDELFELVKGRVDSAGGPKAWKAMQQRQLEFYRGFDQEFPGRSKGAGGDGDEEDGEENECDPEEFEGRNEEGRVLEAERAKGHDDVGEDEDEPVSSSVPNPWLEYDPN
ncbi:hypothetical protein SLS53_003031 [Cytospora paraplurivora]|uniref:Swi5-dependent recombination DNA repair protein 1 n=1 Tax=Cytospora paraplurivora TaxID=2898453 RepID=A0AAN9UEM9_9PEZI